MKLEQRARRNIISVWVLKFVRSSLFIMPVMTIYFQDKWLSMSDVFLLQTIFSIGIFVFEIPTWYFWDLYGRKKSLILWALFWVIWFAIYPYAENFYHFIRSELLLALAGAFISWSDSALVYDTLTHQWYKDSYKKIWWKQLLRSSIWETFAWISWWRLAAQYGLLMPFWVTSLWMITLIPATLALTESPTHESTSKENIWSNLMQIIRDTMIHNEQLKRTILYWGVLASATLSMVRLTQPYLQQINVPLARFWVIRAAIRLSVGLWSYQSHRIEDAIWTKNTLYWLVIFVIVWYLLAATQVRRLWRCVMIFAWVRWVQSNVFSHMVNELSTSQYRATVGSISSMFSRITFCVVWPLVWRVTDQTSLQRWMIASAILFWILWLLACYKMTRFHN
jgi:hypothetical protein